MAYAYQAGISGTVNTPAASRVLSWTCYSSAGGTLTINGGATIPVPAGTGIGRRYETAVQGMPLLGSATTFVFTGTDSFFVETL